MIKLWQFFFDMLNEEQFLLLHNQAENEERKIKTDRIKNFAAKQQSAALGAVIRYALVNNSVELSDLMRDENGKPYLKNNNRYISATHTDGCVQFALAEVPVGIDCEKTRPVNTAIADKYFYGRDADFIRNQADDFEKNSAFLKIWTAREAYSKLCGSGIFTDLSGLCLSDGKSLLREFTAEGRQYSSVCYAQENYITSVCCLKTAKLQDISVEKLDFRNFSGCRTP